MLRRELVEGPLVLRKSAMLREGGPTGAGAGGPGAGTTARLRKEGLSDKIKVGALLATYGTGAAMTEAVLKTKEARRSLATKEIILARKNDISKCITKRCYSQFVKND